MADQLAIAAVIAGFALVLGLLAWSGLRLKRHKGSSAMSVVDEIFHPAAYGPQIGIRQQAERLIPQPPADGPPPPADGPPPRR